MMSKFLSSWVNSSNDAVECSAINAVSISDCTANGYVQQKIGTAVDVGNITTQLNTGVQSTYLTAPSPVYGNTCWQQSQYDSGDFNSIRSLVEDSSAKRVEIELTDGTRLVETFKKSDIHEIKQHREKKLQLSAKFPFFQKKEFVHTTFLHKDRKYDVKADLHTVAKVLGIEFSEFDQAVLESAIAHG